jgi:nitroreductase
MDYMAFKDIVHGRRSIRSFEDKEVPQEALLEIIDCARYAPSDTNSQTWEFLIIKNRDKIKEVEAMTWKALREKAAWAEERGLDKEARLLLRSFGPYATAFADAPVLIICLATPYTSKFRDKIFDPIQLAHSSVWEEEGIKSSCLASQNLMLAAHALGLGSCPMTGPVLLAQDRIREYFAIEPEKAINMVIALGYPSDTPKKLPRKEVADIIRIIE